MPPAAPEERLALMRQSLLCLMSRYAHRPCPLMAAAITRHLRWLALHADRESAVSPRLYHGLASHWRRMPRHWQRH